MRLAGVPRAADLAGNVTLAAWLAADTIRIGLFAGETFGIGWQAWTEAGILGIAAVMVLMRGRPRLTDASPGTLGVAVAATLLPLLYGLLSSQAGVIGRPSQGVVIAQCTALAMMGWATLALGTNFSVLPHYRTLVTAGPYRLVRHPLYASYLLADGTLAVGMASGAAVALWLAELALLADRARREERLLAAADPVYHAYAATVRYRMIPFIL
jgi:protein-S-isoprenylcysteine O-methyltransferase Ste14